MLGGWAYERVRQTERQEKPRLRGKECQWCMAFFRCPLGYSQLAEEDLDHVSAFAWTMSYAGLWLQFRQKQFTTIAQLIWFCHCTSFILWEMQSSGWAEYHDPSMRSGHISKWFDVVTWQEVTGVDHVVYVCMCVYGWIYACDYLLISREWTLKLLTILYFPGWASGSMLMLFLYLVDRGREGRKITIESRDREVRERLLWWITFAF